MNQQEEIILDNIFGCITKRYIDIKKDNKETIQISNVRSVSFTFIRNYIYIISGLILTIVCIQMIISDSPGGVGLVGPLIFLFISVAVIITNWFGYHRIVIYTNDDKRKKIVVENRYKKEGYEFAKAIKDQLDILNY